MESSLLIATWTCNWSVSNKMQWKSAEPLASKPLTAFNKLLSKPLYTTLTSTTCRQKSSKYVPYFTYHLKTSASNPAHCRVEIICVIAALPRLTPVQVVLWQVLPQILKTVSSFPPVSPLSMNSNQHCALRSNLGCRVQRCKFKRWAQVFSEPLPTVLCYSWQHWSHGTVPRYTTSVCVFLSI